MVAFWFPCRLHPATPSVTTIPRRQCCQISCLDPAGADSLMLAKLNTFALVGIDAVPVEAEVDASAGLPKTVLVVTV